MIRSGLARGVVAAALVGVLAGCAGDPSPPVTASPAPSATAPTETAPTETALERQTRLDFEAAEKSYRAFRAEYRRVLEAGGAKKPTKAMTDTAGGPYLAEFVPVIKAFKKLGYTQKGPEKIVYVRPGGYDPKSLILNTCEDGRNNAIYDSEGNLYGRGEIRTAQIEVRKIDGRWKLWTVDGEKVASCA